MPRYKAQQSTPAVESTARPRKKTIAKVQKHNKSIMQILEPKLGTPSLHQAKLGQTHLQSPPSHSPIPISPARTYNNTHKTVRHQQTTTPTIDTRSHTQTQQPHSNNITITTAKPQFHHRCTSPHLTKLSPLESPTTNPDGTGTAPAPIPIPETFLMPIHNAPKSAPSPYRTIQYRYGTDTAPPATLPHHNAPHVPFLPTTTVPYRTGTGTGQDLTPYTPITT